MEDERFPPGRIVDEERQRSCLGRIAIEPAGFVHGDWANSTALAPGCIEADFATGDIRPILRGDIRCDEDSTRVHRTLKR